MAVRGRTDHLHVQWTLHELRRRQKRAGGRKARHLFCNQADASTPLKSAQAILRRLHTLYVPEIVQRGFALPPDAILAGHSLRRGGLNELRDAARRAGWSDGRIVTLMRL